MTVYDPRTRPMYIESPPQQQPQQLVAYAPQYAPQYVQPKRFPLLPILVGIVALIAVLAYGTGQLALTRDTAVAEVTTTMPTVQPTSRPTSAPTDIPNTKSVVAPVATAVPPTATDVPTDVPNTLAAGAALPAPDFSYKAPEGERHIVQGPDATYYTVGESPVRYYLSADGTVNNVVLPGGDPTAPTAAPPVPTDVPPAAAPVVVTGGGGRSGYHVKVP